MNQNIKEKFSLFLNFLQRKKEIVFIIIGGLIFFIIVFFLIFSYFSPPSSPLELRAEKGDYNKVNLTWVDYQECESYNIYRSTELDGEYKKIGSTENRHYSDEGLQPEKVYYYKVTAVRREKESEFSKEAHVTTEGISGVFDLLVEEVGHDYIKLSWRGYNESEGYIIYRSESVHSPFVRVKTTTEEDYIDSDLEPNTPYYYRVSQIVEGVETEKREIHTETSYWVCGTPINHDGILYNTIKIGDQCWFQENLNYETVTGSWCYENNKENCEKYGRLYDWETAMNGSNEEKAQGVCPQDWHVPTDEDFKILERTLGMSRIESNNPGWRGEEEKIGDSLKTETNCSQRGESFCGESLFDVLMGGNRSSAGAYRYIGTHTFFWTSSKENESVWRRLLAGDQEGIHRDLANKENGFYLRCVQEDI